MKKMKLFGFVTVFAALAIVAGTFLSAHADNSGLAVICSGTVSGSNQIVWSAVASSGTAPYSFVWTGSMGIASSSANTTTGTYATSTTDVAYTASVMVTDASSTTATSTCSQTIMGIVPPVTTTTPPVHIVPTPRVNPPSLSIGPNGGFLSRGMTVTSVGTNSFQGTVWGVTYTVNWSGSLASPFEFYYRFLKAGATTTPTVQLQVGDEVGVSGIVASSTPFVVTANVVRDYSITASRPVPVLPPAPHPLPLITSTSIPVFHDGGNGQGNGGNGLGNGGSGLGVGSSLNGNGGGPAFGNGGNGNGGDGNGSSTADLNNRLNQLLQQFQSLQGLLNNGQGGNASGSDQAN